MAPPPPKVERRGGVDAGRSSRVKSSTDDTNRQTDGTAATSKTNENVFAYDSGIKERAGLNVTALTDERSGNRVDPAMTRLVQERVYGYRQSASGTYEYEVTLTEETTKPLKINADRLTYFARKELQRNKLEKAKEFYGRALEIDPRDGRAYLGLSKIAERRKDLKLARQCLRAGIYQSFAPPIDEDNPDRGPNPFLLQALGVLEEKMGRWNEADKLYRSAVKSRPTHAAAWVSLGKLRTNKLRQSVAAARECYQSAERELDRAGLPQSSHVYTAWGMLEYKQAGELRRARELFKNALEIDPRCSVAWLQLALIEAERENYKNAENCFEAVLKFDKRNSRVLQAYAIMESKRPGGISRKAIELFERALKANRRDAGVLQAYALYVADLGDIDGARTLLRTGSEVDKRHAPVWQAWGVLETRYGKPEDARDVFQQGIWACSQAVGHSGGYKCARLWQAWGVLEAREGEYAAARRCFARALDADKRNVPALTSWATMEEELQNVLDARSIYERGLSQFKPGSAEKTSLWQSYEEMEKRMGNTDEAMGVYQRAMRETMMNDLEDYYDESSRPIVRRKAEEEPEEKKNKRNGEVEVYRFGDSVSSGKLRGELWLDEGEIDGLIPEETRNAISKKQREFRAAARAAQENNPTDTDVST